MRRHLLILVLQKELISNAVFLDVAPFNLVDIYHISEETAVYIFGVEVYVKGDNTVVK
jgi:hypothetical protein